MLVVVPNSTVYKHISQKREYVLIFQPLYRQIHIAVHYYKEHQVPTKRKDNQEKTVYGHMHGSFFYSFKYELQICTSCNAGASFVPSPVTATTWPLFLRALTRRSLSLGDDRAITCNVEVWLVPVERSSQQQEHTLNNIRYYVLQGSNKNTCPTYMMRQKVRNASTNSARKLEHNQKRTVLYLTV